MTRMDTRTYPRDHLKLPRVVPLGHPGWMDSDHMFEYGCRQLLGTILDATRWYTEDKWMRDDRYRMIINAYPSDVWAAYTLYEQSILFGELYQHD